MTNRINKDMYYLKIAETVLERSTCLRRRYGAIIVNNDEVVATGYNGAPRGEPNCVDCGYCERETLNIPKGERYESCRSVHAEQNAIISASRKEMMGGTIYIVGKEKDGSYADPAPCTICRRLIVNAGIVRCVGLVDGKVTEQDLRFSVSNSGFRPNNRTKELLDNLHERELCIISQDPLGAEAIQFIHKLYQLDNQSIVKIKDLDKEFPLLFKDGKIWALCRCWNVGCSGGINKDGHYDYVFFASSEL